MGDGRGFGPIQRHSSSGSEGRSSVARLPVRAACLSQSIVVGIGGNDRGAIGKFIPTPGVGSLTVAVDLAFSLWSFGLSLVPVLFFLLVQRRCRRNDSVTLEPRTWWQCEKCLHLFGLGPEVLQPQCPRCGTWQSGEVSSQLKERKIR